MEKMQFKDYVFPHNPASIKISAGRKLVGHFLPGKGEKTEDLGNTQRRAVCNGCFYGETYEDAVYQLSQFRLAAETGHGALFLPGYPPFLARLAELAFEAAGDGRIIPYTMVFVEDASL